MFKLTHSHHQPPSPLPDMSCNGNKFSRLSGNFLNSNYKTKLLSEFHCCKIFMDEQMKHVIPKQQISQIAQTWFTNPTCSNHVYWWVWKAINKAITLVTSHVELIPQFGGGFEKRESHFSSSAIQCRYCSTANIQGNPFGFEKCASHCYTNNVHP